MNTTTTRLTAGYRCPRRAAPGVDPRIDLPPGESAPDPLVERHARPRKEKQAARLLQILESLERSGR